MFELESLAKRIVVTLLKDSQLDEINKAKAEYGLSLLLGIFIELVITLILEALFKVAFYTAIMMFFSLSLRLYTGGAHCSSFARCLIFTVIIFIPLSVLAKYIHSSWKLESIIIFTAILLIAVLPVVFKRKGYSLIILAVAGTIIFLSILVGTQDTWLGALLAISLGLSLQALMLTTLGTRIVSKTDRTLSKLGV